MYPLTGSRFSSGRTSPPAASVSGAPIDRPFFPAAAAPDAHAFFLEVFQPAGIPVLHGHCQPVFVDGGPGGQDGSRVGRST